MLFSTNKLKYKNWYTIDFCNLTQAGNYKISLLIWALNILKQIDRVITVLKPNVPVSSFDEYLLTNNYIFNFENLTQNEQKLFCMYICRYNTHNLYANSYIVLKCYTRLILLLVAWNKSKLQFILVYLLSIQYVCM